MAAKDCAAVVLLVSMVGISTPSIAQNTVSDAMCSHYEQMMANIVLGWREQGIPVGQAESIFDKEDDFSTQLFLRKTVRQIYKDPQSGRKYIQSRQFRADCVKTHRGY